MSQADFQGLYVPNGPRETRWITATVALLATVVFAISASQVVPTAFVGPKGFHEVSNGQIAAFLLNIALLLFAWRRSVELKEIFAERDDWERHAIDLAYHDELTGLCNRRHLKETFKQLSSRSDGEFVLLLIDLDRFKQVNDLYGHEAGDELVAITALRIRKHCPDGAICARLGGDEFAILLSGESADGKKAPELAAKLIEELTSPVRLANGEILIGASVGISRSIGGHGDLGTLLQAADIAMYEAKRLGGNRWVVSDPTMVDAMQRRLTLDVEMRTGLAKKEFVPHFQPIFDLASGELKGFEVLARWRHPEKGLLEPSNFLDAAISSGLISDLSLSVMEKALTSARDWPANLMIAVNVSPVQFKDPLLAQRIIKLLASTGFPASRLDLEIAENSLIADHAFALSTIHSLKNIGIGIVVDDFGTGYASVTRLSTLPFDRLKIDRSFVEAMHDNDSSEALVEAIAILGKGLSIPLSAEGVETEAVQDKLLELGCVDAQGWLFGRALSSIEVEVAFREGVFEQRFAKRPPAARAQS